MIKPVWQFVSKLALFFATASPIYAQGTAFTYQGRLNSGGGQASGAYDLRFVIYSAPTNGTTTSLLLTNSGVAVSNGLFTTTVDFGNGPFVGNPAWLEIAVRTNGASVFTTLSPRQPLTPAPYAIMAGSASNLLGALPASQLSGAITLTQLPGLTVTNFETGLNLSGSFGGTFYGNLGGGTNLSASQITGGTWTNASLNYSYKGFFTNYTAVPGDVVLNCTGTNQIITLPSASSVPPSTLLTIWSDNVNGSVIVTNATGFEAITVPGVGQGLAVYLGPANSPSNSVTLMAHGGHW